MNQSVNSTYNSDTVMQWMNSMIPGLKAQIDDDYDTALIGIRRGGVDVARYLHSKLIADDVSVNANIGELNIAFYRDDFSSIGLHPVVGPSHVPFDIAGMHILLIDDVLDTGRTVRAAMNEIFDYGRPARISLAVLVQRTGHELPIRADVVGHVLDVNTNEYIDWDPIRGEVSVVAKQ